ncbi:unnamed protein product [Didymodactylos carnosus]|uniref:WWE domain-containing protein n=1 Tax=Didymodactylos carnosus TaxID=1234261 RepID=A0A814F051_9BILA|nr:unnamed protein product [Didymodactylos carnosus]CAF0978342.1 unnamed protein product [Didymodactylos carnosus]CAF3729198.1 unnamed protein product [Didymodactylos carnosus]CAF3751129.1 unnamed protein product [Didymodactylos carnosus]
MGSLSSSVANNSFQNVATSSKLTRPQTVWMWKSNVETEEWKRYSDVENRIIEQANQQNKNQVELDDLWIDLKHEIQINKQDSNKERPIKRVTNMSNEYVREERFTCEQPILNAKAFSNTSLFWFVSCKSFVYAAGLRNVKINDELVEKAACGIEEEGAKVNKKKEAEWIANELRKVKRRGEKEIGECCVKLYTMESFLYKLVNKVMREAQIKGNGRKPEFVSERDTNYGRTLGPYCWILQTYLRKSSHEKGTYVYRSANLTNEMIDDYKKHVGRSVSWNSFSSTTKNIAITLNFGGNTLFKIHIPRRTAESNVAISSLSEYPKEEEVLLAAAVEIVIKKVKYDKRINKHVIHLKLWGKD